MHYYIPSICFAIFSATTTIDPIFATNVLKKFLIPRYFKFAGNLETEIAIFQGNSSNLTNIDDLQREIEHVIGITPRILRNLAAL